MKVITASPKSRALSTGMRAKLGYSLPRTLSSEADVNLELRKPRTFSPRKFIKKIALAVFKDKKMLQVRSKKQQQVFFTLGGKIEEGETDLDCLKREVKEEINCEIDPDSIKFLKEFEDVGHDVKGKILNIKMYTGELIGTPAPSSEIAEIGYFDTKSDKKHLSVIAQRTIFPWLKDQGLIN